MEDSKSDIGVIGLAVMGENLALNFENKGFKVSVYNRYIPGVEEGVVEGFLEGRGKYKNISGYTDIGKFVQSLQIPRKILIMVRAGNPVDEIIKQLVAYLSPGDIIIDGGNSHFADTDRRVSEMEQNGFYFIGAGISGGEEGALSGPSIMPGGSEKAWQQVKPILQRIAAVAPDGKPCCEWIGPGGSGHFVKMVHNGIEYGDMQLIAESYWLMKKLISLSNEDISSVFAHWNEGKLRSYLIEITADILIHKDKKGGYLLDKILDVSGQKGTGKWAVINAMELGMPAGLIASAVFERSLSAQKTLRESISHKYAHGHLTAVYNKPDFVEDLYAALYASKLILYAQSFAIIQEASEVYGWKLDLSSITLLWRAGCIIRSSFLNDLAKAFDTPDEPAHLLFTSYFKEEIKPLFYKWKHLLLYALGEELPVPAFSSAMNYFYSLTSDKLPSNLIQAQRDYFGAHMFERTDALRGEFFHENWTGVKSDAKKNTKAGKLEYTST